MQSLHIDLWFGRCLRGFAENPGRAFMQLIAPLFDLVRVNVEIPRQLDQRLLPLIAATATFALNAGLWFMRGRLAMVFSSLAVSCRRCADIPLIPAAQISAPTSQ